jgi:hypothetical protein
VRTRVLNALSWVSIILVTSLVARGGGDVVGVSGCDTRAYDPSLDTLYGARVD